ARSRSRSRSSRTASRRRIRSRAASAPEPSRRQHPSQNRSTFTKILAMENLARTDPEVAEAVRKETRRQGAQLELIASENFVSEAVLEALGTVLTNKYAEGYPGKRYYGGCEYVDVAETLAIERVKKLFGCDHANVQPHSGAQANTSVYMTVCKPGDT